MTQTQSPSTTLSLLSGGEHHTPVQLVSGYPRGLAVGVGLSLGFLSFVAVSLPVLNGWLSFLLLLGISLMSGHWLWQTLRGPAMSLVLFADGTVYYSKSGGVQLRGELQKRSWQRSIAATIEVRFPWGIERFFIFAKLQRPGEYRRLSIWLRHSRTEVPAPHI